MLKPDTTFFFARFQWLFPTDAGEMETLISSLDVVSGALL